MILLKYLWLAAIMLLASVMLPASLYAAETAAAVPSVGAAEWFDLAQRAISILSLVLPIVLVWLKVQNADQKAAAITDAVNVGVNAAYLIARKMSPEERDEAAARLRNEALLSAEAALKSAKVKTTEAVRDELRVRIDAGVGAMKAASDIAGKAGALR